MCIVQERRPAVFLDMKCQTCYRNGKVPCVQIQVNILGIASIVYYISSGVHQQKSTLEIPNRKNATYKLTGAVIHHKIRATVVTIQHSSDQLKTTNNGFMQMMPG